MVNLGDFDTIIDNPEMMKLISLGIDYFLQMNQATSVWKSGAFIKKIAHIQFLRVFLCFLNYTGKGEVTTARAPARMNFF